MQINFPFSVDEQGRLVSPQEDEHIKQMIEQVLFTAPGERVNRPTFGCGVNRWVFEGIGVAVLAANQALIRGSLQACIGDIVQVEDLDVALKDETLLITVQYMVLASKRRSIAQFTR